MFEMREITVAYGDIVVIHGVSLRVEKEEIVSLIGSNGAGKTTLMKTISGLIRPLSGEILFETKRIDHLRPAQIVSLGVSHVPEGRKLFGSLSVELNLEMGAVRKQARPNQQKNLKDIYKLFPILAERKKQLAGSLSGGEQQMLAISRALISEPQLLIMDEPSLGLSPLMTKTILETVVTIRNKGTTVLLVEQNLVQSLRISDRSYILETGRIVRTGSGKMLLEDENVKKKYLGI